MQAERRNDELWTRRGIINGPKCVWLNWMNLMCAYMCVASVGLKIHIYI